MRDRRLVTALAAMVLAAAALIGLLAAGRGIVRELRTASGVPIEVFRPPGDGPFPAVVVAHGFSGNRQLMYAFGHFLARNGYVALLLDFDGHGANTARLPDGFSDAQYLALAANLDLARSEAANVPQVDRTRVAILGHSMGAGAVTRYAAERLDVPATIAISLGNFGRQLPERADMPRNLLVLVGAAEFDGFIDGSTAALTRAYPGASDGTTYGTHVGGTARRLVFVPNSEHITVLFSETTQREVVSWLDATFQPGVQRAVIEIDARMGWLLLLYLAGAIGFYPLASIAFGSRATVALPLAANADTRRGLLIVLAAAVIAPLIMIVVPYRWLPVTVANYVGIFFLTQGLVIALALFATRNIRGVRAVGAHQVDARLILGTLGLTLYALIVFNAPAQFVWNNALPGGARAWVLPILFVCCFVFFYADELLTLRVKHRGAVVFAARSLLIVSLIAAVFVFGAPGFLLLIVPLLPVLFLWHAVYAHWLRQLTGQPWVSPIVNGAAFAWMMATTFAIVRL
jgi:dienelactone hydrolase